MHRLSDFELVDLYENAVALQPVDRVLALLQPALPDLKQEELAALSIGRRDAALLALREQVFGPELAAEVRCPQCEERLEFSLGVRELMPAPPQIEPGASHHFECDGFEITYRLPNSLDLQAVATCAEPHLGRDLLIRRCLIGIRRHGEACVAGSLPEKVLAGLAGEMEQQDPLMNPQIDLTCPACNNSWLATLDIPGYFWTELEEHVQLLLRQVHVLARAYGWRESDILGLPPHRRKTYLEIVLG